MNALKAYSKRIEKFYIVREVSIFIIPQYADRYQIIVWNLAE